MPKTIPISAEDLQCFADLMNELSIENITRDGQLPPKEVFARRTQLIRQWSLLEKKLGKGKITEDDVIKWMARK